MEASILAPSGIATRPARAASVVMVVYIGGWDCPPCLAWKNNDKRAWVTSALYKKVRYVEVESPRLREVYRESYWSHELKPIRASIPEKERWGTPRFLVVKDGRIVANEWGNGPWQRTLAAIRNAVG
jgi:hypothetical protein